MRLPIVFSFPVAPAELGVTNYPAAPDLSVRATFRRRRRRLDLGQPAMSNRRRCRRNRGGQELGSTQRGRAVERFEYISLNSNHRKSSERSRIQSGVQPPHSRVLRTIQSAFDERASAAYDCTDGRRWHGPRSSNAAYAKQRWHGRPHSSNAAYVERGRQKKPGHEVRA